MVVECAVMTDTAAAKARRLRAPNGVKITSYIFEQKRKRRWFNICGSKVQPRPD